MNNRWGVLVTGLGIATVAVATLAIKLWPELGRQREANAELVARVEALEAATVVPVAPAVTPTEPPATAPAVQVAAVQPAPRPTAQPATNAQNPMAQMLEAMQGPQGQNLMSSMMRSMMSQMYPDVGTELDMTAEQVDQLFNLLAKQQGELSADSMALLTGGANDPAAAQAAQRRLTEKQRAHEQEVAAMLGGKNAKWKEYQSTAAARLQVTELRGKLATSGHPLSEAQEKSLVTAFARETAGAEQEMNAFMESPAAASSPNMMREAMKQALDSQRKLVDVAAPILDANQLREFKRQVEQQASMLDSMMGMTGGQADTP